MQAKAWVISFAEVFDEGGFYGDNSETIARSWVVVAFTAENAKRLFTERMKHNKRITVSEALPCEHEFVPSGDLY